MIRDVAEKHLSGADNGDGRPTPRHGPARRHAARRALAGCAVILVAAAGCGSDGGSAASKSDVQAVTTLLVRHYARPSCADLTTAGRTAFGHPVGDAACEADLLKQAPKAVTVTDVQVTGDVATAAADGFHFRLVRRNGRWLIDGGS